MLKKLGSSEIQLQKPVYNPYFKRAKKTLFQLIILKIESMIHFVKIAEFEI